MRRSTDYLYAPVQSSPKAFGVVFFALVVCGTMEEISGGTLWPIFPIPSYWHLLFWVLSGCMPIVFAQLGWTYELTDHELVVRRFGVERHRVALADYVDRELTLGYTRLRFRTRSYWLSSGPDAARTAFLEELDRRLLRAGAVATEALIPSESGPDVTIRFGSIRFPDECVRCGAMATSRIEIEARRGYDFVLATAYQTVRIPVPVCEHHARERKTTGWAVGLGLFVVGLLLVPAMQWALLPPPLPPTTWVLGLAAGALVVRLGQALRVGRLVDAYVLGVSALGIDRALEKVTLRIADERLRARLVGRAASEVRASVFG